MKIKPKQQFNIGDKLKRNGGLEIITNIYVNGINDHYMGFEKGIVIIESTIKRSNTKHRMQKTWLIEQMLKGYIKRLY